MTNKKIEKEATKMFRKIYFKNNIKTFGFFKGLFLNLKLWFKRVVNKNNPRLQQRNFGLCLITQKSSKNLLIKEKENETSEVIKNKYDFVCLNINNKGASYV